MHWVVEFGTGIDPNSKVIIKISMKTWKESSLSKNRTNNCLISFENQIFFPPQKPISFFPQLQAEKDSYQISKTMNHEGMKAHEVQIERKETEPESATIGVTAIGPVTLGSFALR